MLIVNLLAAVVSSKTDAATGSQKLGEDGGRKSHKGEEVGNESESESGNGGSGSDGVSGSENEGGSESERKRKSESGIRTPDNSKMRESDESSVGKKGAIDPKSSEGECE